MDGISLAVGVLPIFSLCLEYFHLFKTAKAASDESQVLLYKLDCEYESFIIWGEKNGFCKTNTDSQVPALQQPGVAQKVKVALGLIERLLSDADELRKKYGVSQGGPLNSLADQAGDMKAYITGQQPLAPPPKPENTNGHTIYPSNSALKRVLWWKTRRQPDSPKLDLIRRSTWAINDRDKFERLVRDIHDLVESLYRVLPVEDKERNAVAIQDIKTLSGDLENLRLFEEASITGYPAWSGAASAILEASSSKEGPGTISQWMAGLEDEDGYKSYADGPSRGKVPLAKQAEDTVYKYSFALPNYQPWTFVFTTGCLTSTFGLSCGIEELEINPSAPSFIFNDDLGRIWGLRNQLDRTIDAEIDTQKLENITTGTEMGSELQDRLVESLYPVVIVNVYCPPCRCFLRTALLLCQKADKLSKYRVRVDDRLPTSCCSDDDKLQRMRSFANALYNHFDEEAPIKSDTRLSWRLLEDLDRLWLEQRIYHLEGRAFDIQDSMTPRQQVDDLFDCISKGDGIKTRPIVMVEANQGAWFLQTPPFPWTPIPPKENQLFEVKKKWFSGTPKIETSYMGTFAARKPPAPPPTPVVLGKRKSPSSMGSARSAKSIKSVATESAIDSPNTQLDSPPPRPFNTQYNAALDNRGIFASVEDDYE